MSAQVFLNSRLYISVYIFLFCNISFGQNPPAGFLDASVGCPPGTFCFTNTGADGRFGPDQAAVDSAYTGTLLDNDVTVSGGIQEWTVPFTGTYIVAAYGAEGGLGSGAGRAGRGAVMQGEFNLTLGTNLKILVGQRGTSSGVRVSGGGGTYVLEDPAATFFDALVIAGGGGGFGVGNDTLSQAFTDADTVMQAKNGFGGNGAGTAGNNGAGGGNGGRAAGGGGIFTNGAGNFFGGGGESFTNGGLGGDGNGIEDGGFGGGGAVVQNTNFGACAGGGGYSGGGGGYANSFAGEAAGGGGGSINRGTNQINIPGYNEGHGLVLIKPIQTNQNNDAGVATVDVNNLTCPGPAQPSVAIKNFGQNTINTVDVEWSVNGAPQPGITFTGLLDVVGGSSSDTAQITLPAFNFPAGPSIVKVWTSQPNGVADPLNLNDTFTVVVEPQIQDPSGLSLLARTGTTATFKWNPATAGNAWLYTINPTGSPLATPVSVTNDSIVVSGLTPETEYEFFVAEYCPAGSDTSNFIGPVIFRTTVDCPVGSYCFTNAQTTGRTGPDQTALNSEYDMTNLDGSVTSFNGIQRWEVPQNGNYIIQALGAQGGSGIRTGDGGRGASIQGEFALKQGDFLQIVVGQQGEADDFRVGGGGGSFVLREPVVDSTAILLIAGGGGGFGVGNDTLSISAAHGTTTRFANDGFGGLTFGTGGNGGNGGQGAATRGAGGGGFFTNGGDGTNAGSGGNSYLNGGEGGLPYGFAQGGFGGGGAVDQNTNFGATGGGGGYSGGGGGYSAGNASEAAGGGGGSFNSGVNQVNAGGANTGHGLVIITPDPNPSSLDIGVLSIDSPDVFCPGTFDVTVTVNNFGTNVINNFDVEWSVDGTPQTPVSFSGVLDTVNGLGSSTVQLTLGSVVFGSAPRQISAYTVSPNGGSDQNNFNDTITQNVVSNLNAPQNIQVSNVNASSAVVNWDGSGISNLWEYVVVPQGANPNSATPVNVSVDSAFVTNLDVQTGYDVYVRELCAAGVASNWAGPAFFVTDFVCPPGAYCFNAGNLNGAVGPDQAFLDSLYAGTNLTGAVLSESGIQKWEIPATGLYKVRAYGAGFNESAFQKGAHAYGEINLTGGDTLSILVGQTGTNSRAGSGGSFVMLDTLPLMIAGGAGGQVEGEPGAPNAAGDSATAGQDGINLDAGTGAGGTAGNGGGQGGACFAQSGAGLLGNGGGCDGTAAQSYFNGGTGATTQNNSAFGGFGGGGTGRLFTNYRIGGGGGYSGGGSAGNNINSVGGGGGSFVSGMNTISQRGINAGNGIVVIEQLVCDVPDSLAAQNITSSSFEVTWQNTGNPDYWQIEWDTFGFAQGTGTVDTLNTPLFSASGLPDSATYQVYVRSICSFDTSVWIGPLDLSTFCAFDSVNLQVVNASCSANNDGEMTALPQNGQSPYTYSWSNGDTLATAAGLSAGAYTVTVTAANACEVIAADTVFENDTVNPVAQAQSITVYLDSNGQVVVNPAAVDNGSTDNCAVAGFNLSQDTFSCAHLGQNPVTFTVSDSSGNFDTATAVITVEDTLSPVLITKTETYYLNANGVAILNPTDLDSASFDNCGTANFTADRDTLTCADLGTLNVTLTAEDAFTNTTSAQVQITVLDTLPPLLQGQNINLYLDASGSAVLDSAQAVNSLSDNCAIDSLSFSNQTFTCADTGTNLVTVFAADFSGNTAFDTVTVQVFDTLPPVVNAQNITVYLDAAGSASIIANDMDNGSADNCALYTLLLSNASFNCSNLGQNQVQLTAMDESGNSATATAVVTVLDTIAPVVQTQSATVYLDSTGTAVINPALVDSGSFDNCGIDSLYLNRDTLTCADLGIATVTLTAWDSAGNTAAAQVQITVLDTLPPLLQGQNINLYLDASGSAVLDSAQAVNSLSDNCAIDSLSFSNQTFTCADTGTNLVTVFAADFSGNTAFDTVTVQVFDTLPPVVNAQNITVYLDAAGSASIIANDMDNGSADNCALYTLLLSNASFNCSNLGQNQVQLTAMDESGNSATATAVVTVLDTIAPVVQTQSATVYLDSTGTAVINPALVDSGSFDNCGIDSLYLNRDTLTCADLGQTTVTLFAEDSSGNTSSASVQINVLDTIAPVIGGSSFTLYLDSNGNAEVDVNQVVSVLTDNCSIDSIWSSQTNFSCADTGGVFNVQITASDLSGNTANGNFQVIVEDTSAPVIVVNTPVVYLDAAGQATLTAGLIDNGTTDNCALDTFFLDRTLFDCNNAGDTVPVVFTAIDVSGNAASRIVSVPVLDTVSPQIVSSTDTLTVYLNGAGTATIDTSDLNLTITTGCGTLQNVVLDRDEFGCTDIGFNTVGFTVFDNLSNSASGFVIVEVLDTFNVTGQFNLRPTGSVPAYSTQKYEVDYVPGLQYTWVVQGGGIDRDSVNTCVVTWAGGMTGTIKVGISEGGGCADTASAVIDLIPLSAGELERKDNAFMLYPNPAREEISIEQVAGNAVGLSQIEVYSTAGRLIKSVPDTDFQFGVSTRITIDDLAAGIYFVKIKTGTDTRTLRFVKVQ